MCIVVATTAHPAYALIVIDNRDEFILRPTSQPHWWASNGQDILSSRDLQRKEQGTWLGINKSGKLAVLTNYRESDTSLDHPVEGRQSRGAMVTAWLASPTDESLVEFIKALFEGEGVHGVGGFSLVCGQLRPVSGKDSRGLKPLAIVSNRSGSIDDVPWIAGQTGEVYGLSNTAYNDPIAWPKVEMGKKMMMEVINKATESGMSEDAMVEKLFAVLDTNTLPQQNGESFEKFVFQLRKSIFIPKIGEPEKSEADDKSDAVHSTNAASVATGENPPVEGNPLAEDEVAKPNSYGTQRQTVLLVDWDGHVSFWERSLWDASGKPIVRGEGDRKFEFQIEGWREE